MTYTINCTIDGRVYWARVSSEKTAIVLARALSVTATDVEVYEFGESGSKIDWNARGVSGHDNDQV